MHQVVDTWTLLAVCSGRQAPLSQDQSATKAWQAISWVIRIALVSTQYFSHLHQLIHPSALSHPFPRAI